MPIRFIVILIFLFSCVGIARTEEIEVHVHDNFSFRLPPDWRKVEAKKPKSKFGPVIEIQTIDSRHVGEYRGKNASLEFLEGDTIFVQGGTTDPEGLQLDIGQWKKKEANPKLLDAGEEIWRINGRVAQVVFKKTDLYTHELRGFANLARLSMIKEDGASALAFQVFYKSDKELPIVRKILQSINWYKDTTP